MDGLRLLVYNGSSSKVVYHRTFTEMDGCVDDTLTNQDIIYMSMSSRCMRLSKSMDGFHLLVYNRSSKAVYHHTFTKLGCCVDDKLTNEYICPIRANDMINTIKCRTAIRLE